MTKVETRTLVTLAFGFVLAMWTVWETIAQFEDRQTQVVWTLKVSTGTRSSVQWFHKNRLVIERW